MTAPSNEGVRLAIPLPVWLLVRILAILAPGWTARKLVQWATTRPDPGRIGQLPVCDSVTGLHARGRPFWVFSYGEEGAPAIYLLHGWHGSHTDFAAIVPALVQSGYRVLLIEAPGHGASPDRESDVGLLVEAYRRSVESFGPARATIGHSVGALAVGVARGDGVETGQVFLVSPFLDPEWWLSALERLGGRRLQREVSALLTLRMGRTPGSLTLRHTSLGPEALVVHDQDDRVVPFETVQAFARHERVWFKETCGLGHRRILFHPGVTLAILHHLKRWDQRG